jgi:hypothetical protein
MNAQPRASSLLHVPQPGERTMNRNDDYYNELDMLEIGLMAAADPEFVARALHDLLSAPAAAATPARPPRARAESTPPHLA